MLLMRARLQLSFNFLSSGVRWNLVWPFILFFNEDKLYKTKISYFLVVFGAGEKNVEML